MKEATTYTLWFEATDPNAQIQTKALRVQAVSDAEAERLGHAIAVEQGLIFVNCDKPKEEEDK